MTKGLFLVLSGPSGVGKGTVHKLFMSKHTDFKLSVSATTRSPRKGEVDGVHYFFMGKEKFSRLVEEGAFAEHVEVYGNCYGTPKSEIERLLNGGYNIILDIEMIGALNIKKIFPEAVLIFVLPPSLEDLVQRLSGRGSETPETMKRRYSAAMGELDYAKSYDYLVINRTPEQCVADIEEIMKDIENNNLDTDYVAIKNLDKIEILKTGGSLC